MEKFGWRGFFEILIGGVLLTATLFFSVRLYLSESEYNAYRSGIFARAYEGSISLVSKYITEKDSSLAPSLSARLAELPLSAKEKNTVRCFTSDIANGDYDAEARERSLTYGEALLQFLARSRSEAYQSSRKRGALGLPDYPTITLPTVLLPKEEEKEEDTGPVKAAKSLLGTSVIRYRREDLICFRTASGFAEYRNGTLVRALIDRQIGDEEASEELLQQKATAFLDAQGYPARPMTLLCSYRLNGVVTFCYENETARFTLSLTKDDGRLHAFRVEAK